MVASQNNQDGGKSKRILILIAVVVILALFVWGVLMAACCSGWLKGVPKCGCMPEVLAALVSTLNAALALNLGIQLGGLFVFGPRGEPPTRFSNDWAQTTLAMIYGIIWFLVSVYWMYIDFCIEDGQLVAVLPEVSKTGLTVFVTVLFAFLGIEQSVRRVRKSVPGLSN